MKNKQLLNLYRLRFSNERQDRKSKERKPGRKKVHGVKVNYKVRLS